MSLLMLAENLRKNYEHDGLVQEVLSGVNLEITEGDVISIVGASGSGKSTLLHILGTLDTAQVGSIKFKNKDLLSISQAALADFRNKELGFVFQFHHLLAEFTALENVAMPLLIRGVKQGMREDQAKQSLDQMGLGNKYQSLPGELSGGEQQRVALARAIVTQPSLLLADEPTGSLDARNGAQMMDLLFSLNENHGLTIIYVSHNPSLAKRAPRQYSLENGRLLNVSH
jgi:lipoprotein-releasing system ATP-binding protein